MCASLHVCARLVYSNSSLAGVFGRQYYDNIVYHNNFSNIAVQYLLLAIAIAAIEI